MFVQPSSLVFLLLIAIWAAYLLQHWIRRREYLATAHSVDRFSDAMRVLERRAPLPEFDLSAPRPRSYAVSPARPSHPEAVVKRAPTVRPEAPARPAAALTDAPVRPKRVRPVLAGKMARRVRGLSLVVTFVLALVVTPLAASLRLPGWIVFVVVGALVADVILLRHAAVSERVAARAAARAGGRTGAYARGSAGGPARADARDTDYFDAESEARVESDIELQYGAETAYDGEAPVAGGSVTSGPIEQSAVFDPYGWAPVPVPPPTYTLKARAADPVPVPVPVDAPANELVDPECWSLDGMVFDCDLDELVERRSGTGA